MEEPFQPGYYYPLQLIAQKFFVHESTVRREISRTPELRTAVVKKFGHSYLPGALLASWSKQPAQSVSRARTARGVFEPIAARSEGELHRRLSKRLEVVNG